MPSGDGDASLGTTRCHQVTISHRRVTVTPHRVTTRHCHVTIDGYNQMSPLCDGDASLGTTAARGDPWERQRPHCPPHGPTPEIRRGGYGGGPTAWLWPCTLSTLRWGGGEVALSGQHSTEWGGHPWCPSHGDIPKRADSPSPVPPIPVPPIPVPTPSQCPPSQCPPSPCQHLPQRPPSHCLPIPLHPSTL